MRATGCVAFDMREERVDLDGLPAKIYDPGEASALFLFGHGGAHSKDSSRFVDLCQTYALRTGLAVVCVDAVDHGERSVSGSNSSLPERWHSSAVPRMVSDWKRSAAALSSIGPPVAYVGYSMGMIFGAPTVASMPGIQAAVFGVGGIPAGPWINDPPLEGVLLDAAANLGHVQLLMMNVNRDALFPAEGTHRFFDAIPGRRKRLTFWDGSHDDWPVEALDESINFIVTHTR
jgi:dienelactone hydrolase